MVSFLRLALVWIGLALKKVAPAVLDTVKQSVQLVDDFKQCMLDPKAAAPSMTKAQTAIVETFAQEWGFLTEKAVTANNGDKIKTFIQSFSETDENDRSHLYFSLSVALVKGQIKEKLKDSELHTIIQLLYFRNK